MFYQRNVFILYLSQEKWQTEVEENKSKKIAEKLIIERHRAMQNFLI